MVVQKFIRIKSYIINLYNKKLDWQEGFETATQIIEELKMTELSGAFCKEFKLLINGCASFLR